MEIPETPEPQQTVVTISTPPPLDNVAIAEAVSEAIAETLPEAVAEAIADNDDTEEGFTWLENRLEATEAALQRVEEGQRETVEMLSQLSQRLPAPVLERLSEEIQMEQTETLPNTDQQTEPPVTVIVQETVPEPEPQAEPPAEADRPVVNPPSQNARRFRRI